MMDKELEDLADRTTSTIRLVVEVLALMIPKVEAMELRLDGLATAIEMLEDR